MSNEFEATFAAAVDQTLTQVDSSGDAIASSLAQKAALGGLMDSIFAIFKQLGAQALERLPELKAAALHVYDTKIAPIQILPPQYAALEALVDAGGRMLVEKGIDALAAALSTPTT